MKLVIRVNPTLSSFTQRMNEIIMIVRRKQDRGINSEVALLHLITPCLPYYTQNTRCTLFSVRLVFVAAFK